jgi:putative flippase GtrA
MTQNKRGQIVRFAIVGIGVALLYVFLYLVFLALGAPQALANIVAFLLAVVVQYLGHTVFTFHKPMGLPDQIVRFICTIGLGLLVSALITGILGPVMGWNNGVSAALVTIILPVQNFLFFKVWVFTETGVS